MDTSLLWVWERAVQINTWEWVGLLLMLVFSGFFSGSETALTALSFSKVKKMLEEDEDRSGKILSLWIDKPNHVLTTILIGNNLVNVAASALATDIASKIFENNGVAIAIGVMTLTLLIFGEITPKTYAKHNHSKIAYFVSKALYIPYYIFLPVTLVFVNLIRAIVKLSGGDVDRGGPFITEEDIEFMIKLGNREGVLAEEKKEMITGIFEIGDIVVREIMVPRTDMIVVEKEDNYGEILRTAVRAGHSRIPVYSERMDNIEGLIYAKDLLKHHPEEEGEFDINAYLRPPYYVPETKKIGDLLKEFKMQRIHMAIVVDEYGGTAGLITLEDILEEIVGDIRDEYDSEEPLMKKIDENTYLVDARMDLDILEKRFDIEMDVKEECESLGGFLVSRMGDIPEKGEKMQYKNMQIVIEEATKKKIKQARITLLPGEIEKSGEDSS